MSPKRDTGKPFRSNQNGQNHRDGILSHKSESRKTTARSERIQNKTIEVSAETEERIEGRNPIIEAIRAGRPIHKLFALKGSEAGVAHIVAMARQAGAVVISSDRRQLDAMSETGAHQGVIAVCASHAFADMQDIYDGIEKSGRPPLIVLCDGIQDPHNLGAIIRSAEIAGAHGVIISRHRSAGLTATCAKSAAGALEYVPVVRAANMTDTIEELKSKGIWVYGASGEGETLCYDADLRGPAAIVIGSEGFGISRLVAQHCDVLIRIPMLGVLNSLNASAACSVLLFEAVRQRQNKTEGR